MSQAKTKMHMHTQGMYPLKTKAKEKKNTHPPKLQQKLLIAL